MKTVQQNQTPVTTEHISFETTDSKGRQIGAFIYTWEVDFVEDQNSARYYTHDVGHFFAFEPHATRDEQPYGALQRWRTFPTVTARAAAIEGYLRAARKRAQRKDL